MKRALIWSRCKEEAFYNEGGQALAQVIHRGGGCLIPENFQGQAGLGLEQTLLVEDAPAHSRGCWTR